MAFACLFSATDIRNLTMLLTFSFSLGSKTGCFSFGIVFL